MAQGAPKTTEPPETSLRVPAGMPRNLDVVWEPIMVPILLRAIVSPEVSFYFQFMGLVGVT